MGNLGAHGIYRAKVIKLRRTHLRAPPDAGIHNFLLVGDHLGLPCRHVHGNLNVTALICGLEHALDRLCGTVHKGGLHNEGCIREVFNVNHRLHEEVLDLDVGSCNERHGAKDTHGLVYRAGVPVHVAVVQALFGSLENFHLQRIVGLDYAVHGVFPHDVGTDGGIRGGQGLSVKDDFRAVAKAVEAEDVAQGSIGLELCGVHPRGVEEGLVYILVVLPFHHVLPKRTGVVEGAGHRAGNRYFYALLGTLLVKRPLGEFLCARARTREHHDHCGKSFDIHMFNLSVVMRLVRGCLPGEELLS